MPGFQSGMMPGEQPVYPAEVAAAECEPCYYGPGGSFMRPCFLDDYWDYTGSRSPTDYACWNGYGPDWCHTWNGRVEWLMWFTSERDVPVRVNTFDGVAIGPGGSLLLVNERVLDDENRFGNNLRHGARVTLGRYLGDGSVRAEGRFWGLEDGSDRFHITSGDNQRLAIPYFDAATGNTFNFVVSAPGGLANGVIDVLGKNDTIGADAWLRGTWWDDGVFRLDGLVGYQFTRMDDALQIRLSRTFVGTGVLETTQDRFITNNEFHGGTLGLVAEWRKRALSFELLGKLAFGNMRERVLIDGRMVTTPPGGVPSVDASGLFAQPSNEGEYISNRFLVVPELNANVVIHLNPAWRVLAGYSLMYFNEAVLAGDQIDPRLNLNQPAGPAFPAFLGRETTFLIQGITLGIDYRW
jgi:hypothetical protein